ncbi:RNA methyltransferase [Candidatus Nitrosacidococcus tergens]|uniref:tRNA (cytidine/uridine-2'-O-)-methyltransferase TrmJ n=1 Tax=Candidatus Nitrosacidococcus tergens TaxID=553981 RepID=A0A7G1Q918_9GAMM|nr:RNA methyltransferase [Candidatus Nitrosacidococcus tergens]CAB1275607.1 putative methyltransferase [Candidatus Nitrosacidococcus tergens]
MLLDQIRIVLVSTTHPGNIGAAARAMHTMGLSQLYLVIPKNFPSDVATARSSGANHLLEQAKVFPNLIEAISDCQVVYGLSARTRNMLYPSMDSRACGIQVATEITQGKKIAIVFGSERIGLENRELDYCNYLVQIPSNLYYSSLNLAAAVQVIAYEIHMAHYLSVNEIDTFHTDSPLSTVSDLENLFHHLEKVLIALHFLDPNKPKFLMRRLRRLFLRIALDSREVNILRGILTAIEKMIA